MHHRGTFPFGVCALAGLLAREANAQESKLASLRSRMRDEPRNVVAALDYGHALRLAGREPEALAQLSRSDSPRVAHDEPESSLRLRWEIARTYMQLADFRHAFAACQSIAPLPLGLARSHACSAEAHLVWMRGGEALSEVRSALASGDSIPEAKVAEGRALELASDDAAAEEAYRIATAVETNDPSADAALGSLLLRTARKDEGLSSLRRALAKEPANAELLVLLGQALPPGEESRRLFEQATHERATWATGWVRAATAELFAHDTAAAKLSARAAVKLAPKDVSARLVLGRVELEAGDAREAREVGQRALQILGNSADAKLLVADAAAKLGEVDDALVAYESAWGLDHSKLAALLNASKVCLAAGRPTSARAFAEKATLAFGDSGAAWVALGDALVAEKDKAGAKGAFQHALEALAESETSERANVARKIEGLK